MSFESFNLGNGRETILSSSGRRCHIVDHQSGNWIVEEDQFGRSFPNREDALDCARELAGDPDLPPLTQM
jgi:hypothetical protein